MRREEHEARTEGVNARFQRPRRPKSQPRRTCLTCGRESVLLNRDRTLRRHYALGQIGYEEPCFGSGTRLYNEPSGPPTFIQLDGEVVRA